MSVAHWLVGALVANLALTLVLTSAMGWHLTRLSFPALLGSMITPEHDRGQRVGWGMHAVNGFAFGLLYVAGFHVIGRATWWLGALAGSLHGAVVLAAALPALPSWHPRMASEELGTSSIRQLEPPGFFGRNYGGRTPELVLLAHVLFGAALGIIYRV